LAFAFAHRLPIVEPTNGLPHEQRREQKKGQFQILFPRDSKSLFESGRYVWISLCGATVSAISRLLAGTGLVGLAA